MEWGCCCPYRNRAFSVGACERNDGLSVDRRRGEVSYDPGAYKEKQCKGEEGNREPAFLGILGKGRRCPITGAGGHLLPLSGSFLGRSDWGVYAVLAQKQRARSF